MKVREECTSKSKLSCWPINLPRRSTSNMSISEFYAGKTIAITGGTGFIGHCLVEKLLRGCPQIKKIYLLMRPKRNQSREERLKNLTDLPVFDKLREEQPDFTNKLLSLDSDLKEPYLGLSEESIKIIKDEVNVIFHSAATIRFNEHLRVAFTLNTIVVKHILEICKDMKDLQALVHISTAYSQCDRIDIGEEVYELGVTYNNISHSLKWMNDSMIDKITPEVVGNRPNTYTLTKALAEYVISEDDNNLPIAILRPSIVGPTWSEPVPGWVSNFNGATGIIVAYGKGMLQSLRVGHEIVLDVIPVDFTVNSLIAAGWKTGLESNVDKSNKSGKNYTVYNITTGANNPNYLDKFHMSVQHWVSYYPFNDVIRYPAMYLTSSNIYHKTMMTMFHFVPAYLVDFVLTLLGKKPRFMKVTGKMNEMLDVLEFFLSTKWRWSNDNLMKLFSEMTPEDRKKFNFDPRSMDWDTYIMHYTKGCRKFLLKENPDGYQDARNRLKRIRILGYAINCVAVMMLWRFLVAKSTIAQNLWHFVTNMCFKFLRFFQISSTVHGGLFFGIGKK